MFSCLPTNHLLLVTTLKNRWENIKIYHIDVRYPAQKPFTTNLQRISSEYVKENLKGKQLI